jgi:threonine synthase
MVFLLKKYKKTKIKNIELKRVVIFAKNSELLNLMKLYSTNNKNNLSTFKEAIFAALAPDKGLYMPISIPQLSNSFLKDLKNRSLQEMAFEVASTLIGDEIPKAKLEEIISNSINFETPLIEIGDGMHALELFHGPTLAFKDVGARFMSRAMAHFLPEGEKLTVLVATSGDTGSAVANGFYKTKGIEVVILYPKGKVSGIQEKQLTTMGENVTALEVDGNFDDCQELVKQAFSDQDLRDKLNLTSANSINIARLIPQSFYYLYAASRYPKSKTLTISVPSGNFGNLTAGLFAQKMGAPIDYFIAATNNNDIIPQYLETGKYKPNKSISTISNAMDVGYPSNFVRMEQLFTDHQSMIETIYGFSLSDSQTSQSIKEAYEKYNYTLCPHSAIAYKALENWKKRNNDGGVFLCTAHPSKFADIVEKSIGAKVPLPESVKELQNKKKLAINMEVNYEAFTEFLTK